MPLSPTTPKNGIAGICSASGNGNTGAIRTLKMRDAFVIDRALVGTAALNRKALVTRTREMGIPVTASKLRITGILTIARDGDTLILLAFRMRAATDFSVTLIRAVPLYGDTLIAITEQVGVPVTATEDGITFVVTFTRNGDTGFAQARRMLNTGYKCRTFVGTGTRCIGALASIAGKVCCAITATKDGITGVGAISWNSNALISLTFRVLIATDEDRTLIGSGTSDGRTLGTVTGKMLVAIAAAEHGIAVVGAVSR